MEQAPLLFDVFGEPMRVLLGVGQVDDDARPLLPFHAVDGRQTTPSADPFDRELAAQPRSNVGRVVVQRGEVLDGGEVVALRRAVHPAAGGVERRHRSGEPDLVDQREHEI